MRHALRWTVLLAVVGMMLGCSTQFVATSTATYPPYTGIVRVFDSPPQGLKYEEIGVVTVTRTGPAARQLAGVVKAMQKKAAAMGANAIVMSKLTGGAGGPGIPMKDAMAMAIRIAE